MRNQPNSFYGGFVTGAKAAVRAYFAPLVAIWRLLAQTTEDLMRPPTEPHPDHKIPRNSTVTSFSPTHLALVQDLRNAIRERMVQQGLTSDQAAKHWVLDPELTQSLLEPDHLDDNALRLLGANPLDNLVGVALRMGLRVQCQVS